MRYETREADRTQVETGWLCGGAAAAGRGGAQLVCPLLQRYCSVSRALVGTPSSCRGVAMAEFQVQAMADGNTPDDLPQRGRVTEGEGRLAAAGRSGTLLFSLVSPTHLTSHH